MNGTREELQFGILNRRKVLLYGASGFLGGTIYEKLKQLGHDVVGTYSTNATNNELVKVDLLNTEETLAVYRKVKPEVII